MPAIELANIERYAATIKAGKVQGKILDPVPKIQRQEGPNCGFYALSIVMHYWKDKGRADIALPARKRDLPAADVQEPLSLRELGKQTGALDIGDRHLASTGGVFTATQLAAVARAANFDARIITRRIPQEFITTLGKLLDADVAPIVAFDVEEGDPVLKQGEHSHWGVIVGQVKHGTSHWLIATHGHGKYYNWTAGSLQQSNFGLCNTTRKLQAEVKVRLILKNDAKQDPTFAPLTRWHWANTKTLKRYKDIKAMPNSRIQDVEFKTREIKGEVDAAHDLGCHIVCVIPRV